MVKNDEDDGILTLAAYETMPTTSQKGSLTPPPSKKIHQVNRDLHLLLTAQLKVWQRVSQVFTVSKCLISFTIQGMNVSYASPMVHGDSSSQLVNGKDDISFSWVNFSSSQWTFTTFCDKQSSLLQRKVFFTILHSAAFLLAPSSCIYSIFHVFRMKRKKQHNK